MVSDFTIGTILSLASAFLFGAQSSFPKLKSVRESQVAVPIYSCYFLIGASLVCFLEYFIMLSFGSRSEFTYLGILSALSVLCAETFIVLSIQQIGVGYATGFIPFPVSVLTPVLQYTLGQSIYSMGITVLGLVILAFSAFLMSILSDLIQYFGFNDTSKPHPKTSDTNNVRSDSKAKAIDVELDTEKQEVSNKAIVEALSEIVPKSSSRTLRKQLFLGLAFSTSAAMFHPFIPLPSLYAPAGSSGLNFFLSFGIGCLVVTPLSAVTVLITERGNVTEKPDTTDGKPQAASNSVLSQIIQVFTLRDEVWHFKEVAMPAMSAGIIWSLGNMCGFMAFWFLSFAIVVSFVQCQVIVSMILSIMLWREFTTAIEIGTIFTLAVLMVGGCVVVTYGVFGSFG